MNAYELAEKWELSLDVWDDRDYTSWCYDASSMLRQQADQLDKVIPQLVKANGLIENLRIRIAELEKELACVRRIMFDGGEE
jgi:D-serine dehydratase